ncbi:Indoleamine 2,3-dioxygenase [Flagelloscypha sp. PMI_526]|nr:Indoleamine 2,3-dioxygenase [Flagelloscypha sp. PMI_526]
MDIFNLLPTPGDFLGSGLVDYVRQTLKAPPRDHRSRIDFDVDPASGFIPRSPPRPLQGAFSLWEAALTEAPHVITLGEDLSDAALDKRAAGELWRLKIRSWPVLEVSSLCELRECQRAHLVLSWLLHYYVHSIPNIEPTSSPVRIPAPISVPLVAVSKKLDTAPVLTFADCVLWNWEAINPSLPFSEDNARIQNNFSGTQDEENFYRSSLRTESIAAEMLRIFDEFQDLRDVTTIPARAKIARDLSKLRSIIDDVRESIVAMRGEVDPHVFYWDIRPWWVGNTHKTWIYDGISNTDNLMLDGPSAGQSSSMHALDVFLSIDHKKNGHDFMYRMRQYMPGKHRDYLKHIGSPQMSLRSLAQQAPGVRDNYDLAVSALKKLRDAHIRIATLYVVSMSKKSPTAASGCPVAAMMEKMDREEAQRRLAAMGGYGLAKGTGGNELSKLLKAGRDATGRALLTAR